MSVCVWVSVIISDLSPNQWVEKGSLPYSCCWRGICPPKPQIPCFSGFVFWRQCDSVLITILEHGEKEKRHRNGAREEKKRASKKPWPGTNVLGLNKWHQNENEWITVRNSSKFFIALTRYFDKLLCHAAYPHQMNTVTVKNLVNS